MTMHVSPDELVARMSSAMTRREFVTRVQRGAVAACVASAFARPSHAQRVADIETYERLRIRTAPEEMRALAVFAVDAARSAGATYADARVTRTVEQATAFDAETYATGVRVLVDGAWGFAAGPWWDRDAIARLSCEAVAQARENAKGNERRVELVPASPVTGNWIMPGIDPFDVTIEERKDFLMTWDVIVAETPPARGMSMTAITRDMTFRRQERAFASTEGSDIHQITYRSYGKFSLSAATDDGKGLEIVSARGLHPQGKGWELFADANLREQARLLRDELAEYFATPEKRVDIGRYDVVSDAEVVGLILAKTFGVSTQLDRALGYEANAGGAGALGNDPLVLLGQHRAASPLVTITADRTTRGAPSHVQWDDEGVAPERVVLVDKGTLADFQTTRELTPVLAPYYKTAGRSLKSNGCASAPDALDITMLHAPHLTLTPAQDKSTFADLVSGTSRGIAWTGTDVVVDFQGTTGASPWQFREIVNGKLGARLVDGRLQFRTQEFWKSVTALGGWPSVRAVGAWDTKGEPAQRWAGSASAVPAVFKNITFVH